MANRSVNVASGTSGLRPAFPEAVDYMVDSVDNNWKYMGPDGIIRQLEVALIGGSSAFGRSVIALSGYANNTGVGNGADATDDTLFTYNLPAGALTGGSGFQRVVLTAFVVAAANGNTKTLKFKFGATPVSITLNPTTTAPNAKTIEVYIEVAFVDATHQVINVSTTIGGNSAELVSITAGNETGANALAFTITGSSGSSVANDLVLKSAEVIFEN